MPLHIKIKSLLIIIHIFITVQLFAYDSTPIEIHIPESQKILMVKEKIVIRGKNFLKADYVDEDERGNIYIDISKDKALISQDKINITFARLFYISNQGSGSFAYVGLFVQDTKN